MLGFVKKADDKLFNRRRMSVVLIVGAVLWAITILICDVIYEFNSAEILAYLGFVTALAGLPTWGYLKACSHEDKEDDEGPINNEEG